jgi:esterase/lipase superfamily enzyme
MILILSDREITPNGSGVNTFEPCIRPQGSSQVLLAMATPDAVKGWGVRIIPSNPVQNWSESNICTNQFETMIKRMVANESGFGTDSIRRRTAIRPYAWIFFIPGYTSNLRDSLAKARELEESYNANVILYSWPADPTGSEPNRYHTAEQASHFSTAKLRNTLKHLNTVFVSPARDALDHEILGNQFRICLLAHSLGNRLLETLISQNDDLPETEREDLSMFDSIILHQADVDASRAGTWIPKVKAREKVYITTHLHDRTLVISDWINATRLGTDILNFDPMSAPKTDVVDLTHAENSGNEHWFFTGFSNLIVQLICERMVYGTNPGEQINSTLETKVPFNKKRHVYEFTSA